MDNGILNVEEPCQYQAHKTDPEHLLLSLASRLFNSEQLPIRIIFVFIFLELLSFPHLLDLFFGPHSFEIVGAELGVNW